MMEPSRQFKDVEDKILKFSTKRFEDTGLKLLYGKTALHHVISAVTPRGRVVGSVGFSPDFKHTQVYVHPDYQRTVVGAHLLAAASKFSNEKLGHPLYGDRSTTDESFKLVQKFFPSDSTKITRRESAPDESMYQINKALKYSREGHLEYSPESWKLVGKPTNKCFSCAGSGETGDWIIPVKCKDCKGTGIESKGRTVNSELGL